MNPQDDKLKRLLSQLLTIPEAQLDDDCDLIHQGLDSLRTMRAASQLRRDGIDIRFSDLILKRTVGEWRQAIADSPGLREEPAPVASAVDEGFFDLATMQHAFWIGRQEQQQLGGVSAHFYLELEGKALNPQRLEVAFGQLLQRHPMLRLRIDERGQLHIAPTSDCRLIVHDFSGLKDDSLAAQLEALRQRYTHQTLDIEQGETMMLALSLLPGGRSRLHLDLDMIAGDAASLRILLRELGLFYQDQGALLPPLTFSYPQYRLDNQRQYAQIREQDRQWWQPRLDTLAGAPTLPLYPDSHRTPRTERHYFWLDDAQSAVLMQRSQHAGLTAPVVLATLFAETIGAWSGGERFLLNLPVFSRDNPHPQTELLVGDFSSSVLINIDSSKPASFNEQAQELQTRLREALAHAAWSGVDVLRERSREQGQPVLAPVVFTSALALGELYEPQVQEILGKPIWTISQGPQVWIDAQVTEYQNGILINWDVRADLFIGGVVDAMFDRFKGQTLRLLEEVSYWREPLPPFSPVVPWQNEPQPATKSEPLLYQRFFTRAAETPQAVALVWGEDGSLTYGELKTQALRVAGFLRQQGIMPGECVGVSMGKGVGQIIAVLGILAAGAVYVPCGIDVPRLRRETIFATADVRLAFCDDRPRYLVDFPDNIAVFALEQALNAQPADDVLLVDSTTPMYIIFTSGSTGMPKGVEVSHRAVANTIDAVNALFAIGERDRSITLSELDFDLSAYDIFAFLSCGGSLAVVDEDQRRDGHAWVEIVRRWQVTVISCVPALLDMILTAATVPLPMLRLVMMGGDRIPAELANTWWRLTAQAQFVGLGGMTEAAIHSTVFELLPDDTRWSAVPWGRPLAGMACRIVDNAGRDCPPWVPGELWVSGPGLACGYRKDDTRTAEKFVHHAGRRWYRSGDRVRYWPDGLIEYIGRTDHQVKIRGHRIELGEVEAALLSHPAVMQACVTVVTQPSRQLSAALVVNEAVDRAALRRWLQRMLPGYAIPEHYRLLDDVPLTANGKIDRNALQQQAQQEPLADKIPLTAPESEIERLVAGIWQDLLQVAQIWREDNFFMSGGDSLLATRAIARLRERQYSAPLSELFANPTLADFCRYVQPWREALPTHITADEQGRYAPFPLSDIQRAFWIGRGEHIALGGVGSHFYIEFDGDNLDVDRLEAAWQALITHHDMLRAVVLDDGRQQVLEQTPAWTLRQHVLSDGDEEALLALRETLASRVYDVTQWPLFDIQVAHYQQKGVPRQRLMVSLDSIMLDGRSIMILFTQWDNLYQQPGASLPPLTIQYRDYVRQNPPADNEKQRASDYWRQQLASMPAAPALPLATPPENIRHPRFRRWHYQLAPERWAQFKSRARRYGMTPSVALAAAYGEVLSRWSNQASLAINLTLFDRQPCHPHIDSVVGDFASILLLAYQRPPHCDFLTAAKQLQRQEGEGLTHREISGIEVLRELARQRGETMAHMPIVFTSVLGLAKDASLDLSPAFPQQVYAITQTPQVWLDAKVSESRQHLMLDWDAVESLFPEGMISAMFSAWCQLIEHLAQADWHFPLPHALPEAQRQCRERVNQTDETFATDRPLYLRIFQQALLTPAATALMWGEEEQMDYQTLRERALRVAGGLVLRGIEPGERVAITQAKGVMQIIAVLGVLAAGGCYVPAGIGLPLARRETVYRDAGVRWVLTDEVSASQLAWPENIAVIRTGALLNAAPLEAPVEQPTSAAKYIIFTSGSTGKPKGVVVSHRAVANTVDAVAKRFSIDHRDRSITLSALDFDLSAYDIFTFLSVGASLVVVDEAERRDAAAWVQRINRWQVSVISAVPALVEMIVIAAGQSALTPSLRLVMVGGDRVLRQLPQDLWRVAPQARFAALGGMTEAAIHSTCHEILPDEPWWACAPYGVPLSNMRCRVVDYAERDCPDGVKGELWVSGAGLAERYYGDPRRSAEKFVTRQQRRWYRTGDIARYRPDGVLEFFGRVDSQVKIRGHRIELGEVEGVFSRLPQVDAAVAVVVAGAARKLAVALTAKSALDLAQIKAAAMAHLPDYEVPEYVLQIAAIPLTANGKVDREAIAAKVAEQPRQQDASSPVSELNGDIEHRVASLWAELLGQPVTRGDDNFFALGGDSLIATRLMSRLQKYGLRGALAMLFNQPHLRDFAATLEPVAAAPQAALRHDEAGRFDPFPLTDVQQAYWLGRQPDFTLGGIAAQCYSEYELPGLDIARMERAWNRLVTRHDMLRCVIDAEGQQRVLPQIADYTFRRYRLEPGPHMTAQLQQLREEVSRQLLSTSEGRLYDIRVIEYDAGQVRLAVLFDNLMVDGLSMLTLFSELFHYYQQPDADLPRPEIGFRDYLLWRQKQGEDSAAKHYWRQRLDSLPSAPQLPTRIAPSAIATPHFTRLQHRLPTPLWQRLNGRAREAGITPSVLLLTCFAEVLSRWSGQSSLVVNMTLFDRQPSHPDIHHVVGDFTSLILAEYHAQAQGSWFSHAQRLQAQIWRDLDNQQVSAVTVMREMAQQQGSETRAVPVVFTSMLGVADAQALAVRWPDFTCSQTPQVWLDHQVIDLADGLLLSWDYLTALFPEQMIEQMFSGYCAMLHQLAEADWAQPIRRELPPEQQRVRAQVNATSGCLSADTALHQAFFRQAKREPQRQTLWDSRRGFMTAGDLRENALRIAAALRQRGVNPGDRVALCCARGSEQIASLLGILAAGAVWLPVNPAHPAARQAMLCHKAQARLVISDRPLSLDLPVATPETLLMSPPLSEPVIAAGDTLAYILFTSGSTGEPKGVEIEHRSVLNTLDDIGQRYDIGKRDVLLGVAALDFDLAVFDVFAALNVGALLVLTEDEGYRDAESWLALMVEHQVSIWNSVPMLLEMLIDVAQLRSVSLPALRLALLSGDWIATDIAARLRGTAPDAQVIALGGATEASIWSNAWPVAMTPPDGWQSVPYGLPLRNQQFRVVDSLGFDAPDWVAGELLIGGQGVARGYCADEALTQAQFSGAYPLRWYRTGDRGRYRPDGVLEFLGRRDGQIKLRGHRIELGEIEHCLLRHENVRRAAAFVQGEGMSARIVAFVEMANADTDALILALREQLPGYAVPGAIVALEDWPLTANGKVDRRRLLAMQPSPQVAKRTFTHPVQQAVAHAWQRAVGGELPQQEDNFFAVGGNSLSGTRLVANLCKHFGITLTLREFFADASFLGLCASVERHLAYQNSKDEGLL